MTVLLNCTHCARVELHMQCDRLVMRSGRQTRRLHGTSAQGLPDCMFFRTSGVISVAVHVFMKAVLEDSSLNSLRSPWLLPWRLPGVGIESQLASGICKDC